MHPQRTGAFIFLAWYTIEVEIYFKHMADINGEISLEALARMIKVGFDDVDKQFQGIDGRLDKIDDCLDSIDGRLDKIDGRLDKIENLILTDHRHRLEYLELEVQRMKDLFAFK